MGQSTGFLLGRVGEREVSSRAAEKVEMAGLLMTGKSEKETVKRPRRRRRRRRAKDGDCRRHCQSSRLMTT